MAKISPSLLSADFSNLEKDIKILDKAKADYIHLDVMDGVFVPNISFGIPVIKSIRKLTKIPFDTHLMIDRPERYIKEFVDAGSDMITVHIEACTHLHRVVQDIRSYGIKAGVSLNPSSSIENIKYILDEIDLVLIMTVNPGFGGQKFIPSMKNKIMDLKNEIVKRNLNTLIEVDGGVTIENARSILECGCDILVSGSDIFNAKDIVERITEYREL